jgi:hypothetical protein
MFDPFECSCNERCWSDWRRLFQKRQGGPAVYRAACQQQEWGGLSPGRPDIYAKLGI